MSRRDRKKRWRKRRRRELARAFQVFADMGRTPASSAVDKVIEFRFAGLFARDVQ